MFLLCIFGSFLNADTNQGHWLCVNLLLNDVSCERSLSSFFLFLFFFLYKCESTVKNVPLHKKVNCFYDCIRTTRIKWLSFKRTSALCWQFAVAYGQWKAKVLDTLFPFFSDQIPSLSVPFCFHFDTHSWNSVKFSCCGEVWGISVKISCSWNQAHSFSMAEMSS